MNAKQISEFFKLFAAECKKRPEIKREHCATISVGWSPSLVSELVMTVEWFDGFEKKSKSIIYPPEDWKEGMNGLLDDLLSRSVARKAPKHITCPY